MSLNSDENFTAVPVPFANPFEDPAKVETEPESSISRTRKFPLSIR